MNIPTKDTDSVTSYKGTRTSQYSSPKRVDNPNLPPLTLSNFIHSYTFYTSVNKSLQPDQLDRFISMYYSHIEAECRAYLKELGL